jgi:phage FluMu gp28-like protein
MRRLRPFWREAPDRLMTYLLDPVWFFTLLGSWEDEPIRFDHWQVTDLHDYARLRAREKAPQIGFSWNRALEAVHEAVLFDDAATSFVSIDQREASNKILYARKLWEGLPPIVRRVACPLINASREELDFGSEARPAIIRSVPSTAGMRGYANNVVLDESDFYRDGGRAAYRAAIGRIARGYRATIGSTCWGRDTILDVIMGGLDRYAGDDAHQVDVELRAFREIGSEFSRAVLPYTVSTDPEILAAVELARISSEPEDFREEYECVRGGGGLDTFSPELIRSATHGNALADTDGDLHLDLGPWAERDLPMTMAVDVGESRNPSVVSVSVLQDDAWRQIALYEPVDATGQRLGLEDLRVWAIWHADTYPSLTIGVDAAGVGAGTADALERRYRRRFVRIFAGSRPKDLPPQDRREFCVELRRAWEAGAFEIVPSRELSVQARRTRIMPNGTVEQPGSRHRSHYDHFWATAYDWYVARVRSGRRRRSSYEHRDVKVLDVSPGRRALKPGRIEVLDARPAAVDRIHQAERDALELLVADVAYRGRPIPWRNLSPDQADVLDDLLADAAATAIDAGEEARAVLLLEERRRRPIGTPA